MNRAYQMILIFFLAVSLASFSDYLLVQSLGIVVSPTEHRIYNSFDKKPHNLMEGSSSLEGGGLFSSLVGGWAMGLRLGSFLDLPLANGKRYKKEPLMLRSLSSVSPPTIYTKK